MPEKNRRQQGQFKPGHSGNPKGRPRGARNKVTRELREILEAEAPAILRRTLERAREDGSADLTKAILQRLDPPKKHAHREPYNIGPLTTLAECTTASQRLAEAVAAGEVDEDHADAIAKRITDTAKLIESSDLEQRLQNLERAIGSD